MSEQITTAEERDDLLRSVGEQAEPAVIRVGFRPYILTEDERGEFWGWSWIEEGERRGSVVARGLALPWTVLYRPDTPATDGEPRDALAAMVREGKAAGMYADDHGAAGFCTDHGQAALDVDAIRRRVEYAISHGAVNHDLGRAILDALAARDAEVERLTAINGAITSELRSAMAEVERLRAVGPIAWTFGQRARADRAEATVARVEAECERWLSSLGRPAPDRLDFWTNGARAFAEHLAALVTDTPTDPDEGADCG